MNRRAFLSSLSLAAVAPIVAARAVTAPPRPNPDDWRERLHQLNVQRTAARKDRHLWLITTVTGLRFGGRAEWYAPTGRFRMTDSWGDHLLEDHRSIATIDIDGVSAQHGLLVPYWYRRQTARLPRSTS